MNDEADTKATEATQAETRLRRLADQTTADDVAKDWAAKCMDGLYKGVQSFLDAHDSGTVQKFRGIFEEQEW